MNPIEGKLYSPFLKITQKPVLKPGFKFEYEIEQNWERFDATVNKIRISEGYPVSSFRQLIEEVAIVTLSNKNYEMFYRGQSKDYKDSQSVYYKDKKPRTIIYPSICRPEKKENGVYKQSVRQKFVQKRYDELYELMNNAAGTKVFNYELYFSLFQHYDICPTPLIDITQSLRVAATFALRSSDTGYVYVFGLPYPNQSISHYTDMGIVLVKLQNVCPVDALRPRYQEGYLVGKYPYNAAKEGRDNLARRLVAKFFLDNKNGKFWDQNFQPIPEDVLYPKNDMIETRLKRLKEKYYNANSKK